MGIKGLDKLFLGLESTKFLFSRSLVSWVRARLANILGLVMSYMFNHGFFCDLEIGLMGRGDREDSES